MEQPYDGGQYLARSASPCQRACGGNAAPTGRRPATEDEEDLRP